MTDESMARLARTLLDLNKDREFDVDVLDDDTADRLGSAFIGLGCAIERRPFKTCITVIRHDYEA